MCINPEKDTTPSHVLWVWGWICVLSFLVFLSSVSFAEKRQVHVQWIPDGDTLFLQSGERVRLKGIDAPEIGHDDRPSQYYAMEARQELQSLVMDKTLCIEQFAQTKKDRFGRLLAYVRMPDGRLLNTVLLERGCAFCYFSPDQEAKLRHRFLEAQRRAVRDNKGFWPRILTIPAASDKYRGNKRSRRFHDLQCPFGKKIHTKNRDMFLNLREAFMAGFAPCRRCTPWPSFNH
jgi:micrococcal nuclease